MPPSSIVQLGNSTVFLHLSTRISEMKPELPIAVDNIFSPSLLTLFTPV